MRLGLASGLSPDHGKSHILCGFRGMVLFSWVYQGNMKVLSRMKFAFKSTKAFVRGQGLNSFIGDYWGILAAIHQGCLPEIVFCLLTRSWFDRISESVLVNPLLNLVFLA